MNRAARAGPKPLRSQMAWAALLLLSQTLFLWMYSSVEPVERLADRGLISGCATDARLAAYEFAARWRHGMAGNSPIFMPGFFAVAAACWFWSQRKGVRRILLEGALVMGLAVTLASALALPMHVRTVRSFLIQTGCVVSGRAPDQTAIATAQAMYTLAAWSSVVVCARMSAVGRRLLPLVVPASMNLVLPFVRPWTVDELTSYWLRQSLRGDPVALGSLAMVPLLALLLALAEMADRRSARGEEPPRRLSQ